MTKLITLWAAWRLLRALAAIVVIATLALIFLGGMHRTAGQAGGLVRRLRPAISPTEQQLQRTLQKATGR